MFISIFNFIFSFSNERSVHKLFLLLALYGIAVWYKTEKITSIFVALTGFLGAVFFHGSMIVGAIIFVIIIGLSSFKKYLLH